MRLILYIFTLTGFNSVDALENLCRRPSTALHLSSTYSDRIATLANDGNLNTTYSDCSHTDVNQNIAWIQVDLGVPYSISDVKLYYRKVVKDYDRKPYRLRQFYMDISNSSASTSTTGQRTRCYTDNTTYPAVPPNILNISCKQTARFIIFETTYNPPEDYSGAILEVCEIEVYGCEIGKFGESCLPCQGCRICDVNNGVCAPTTTSQTTSSKITVKPSSSTLSSVVQPTSAQTTGAQPASTQSTAGPSELTPTTTATRPLTSTLLTTILNNMSHNTTEPANIPPTTSVSILHSASIEKSSGLTEDHIVIIGVCVSVFGLLVLGVAIWVFANRCHRKVDVESFD